MIESELCEMDFKPASEECDACLHDVISYFFLTFYYYLIKILP